VSNQETALNALLASQQVASLGTLHKGERAVSMVPFALLAQGNGVVIHVSSLATHTGDMLDHAGVSLLVIAPPAADVAAQATLRLALPGRRGSARWTIQTTPKRVNRANPDRDILNQVLDDLQSDAFVKALVAEARKASMPVPDADVAPMREKVSDLTRKIGRATELAIEAQQPRPWLEKNRAIGEGAGRFRGTTGAGRSRNARC